MLLDCYLHSAPWGDMPNPYCDVRFKDTPILIKIGNS